MCDQDDRKSSICDQDNSGSETCNHNDMGSEACNQDDRECPCCKSRVINKDGIVYAKSPLNYQFFYSLKIYHLSSLYSLNYLLGLVKK
ncbi:hypothetical protein FACS1894152_6840 [Bacilli bacterium]|nr:hypothetical protein FACS1894152_6840 [Bacilli bacterium]